MLVLLATMLVAMLVVLALATRGLEERTGVGRVTGFQVIGRKVASSNDLPVDCITEYQDCPLAKIGLGA